MFATMCVFADTRQKIRNLATLNDEKHCFTGERRSDIKHTGPPLQLALQTKSCFFLLRVVVQIISARVMKLKNSLAILFLSLRSILLMPAQF
jgi:hypothetical protein